MVKKSIVLAICLLLVCAMAINLTGCGAEGSLPDGGNPSGDYSSQDAAVTDFAIRLFQNCEENGKNTLISPLSVLCALAMTANGAQNETLEQMESVLGMPVADLNQYLHSYMENLPRSEDYKLSLANSIWFQDHKDFTVNADFLALVEEQYAADIYKVPFDEVTCRDINNWVNEKTDEMIPQIIDQISPDAVMYLINALAFDAKWESEYNEHAVKPGQFTTEDGEKQDVEFMYNSEHAYLEDKKATGFMKYYKGGKYAFVAMLPNEGVTVSEYIASLDGESLHKLLANPKDETVYTSIPKFETEYEVQMAQTLKTMGMPKAFDLEKAEFAGLGSSAKGNIYISQVLHKTYISVAEQGTKAGAATVVVVYGEAASPNFEKPKEVHLDRPFVYMLVDCENNIPFFIGTVMDPAQ